MVDKFVFQVISNPLLAATLSQGRELRFYLNTCICTGEKETGKALGCLSQGFCDFIILLVVSLVLQRSHDTVQNKDILQLLNSSWRLNSQT